MPQDIFFDTHTHSHSYIFLFPGVFVQTKLWLWASPNALHLGYAFKFNSGRVSSWMIAVASTSTTTLGDAVYDDAPAWLSEFTAAWSPPEQWPHGVDPGSRVPSDGAIVQVHSQALAPAWPTAPSAMNFDFDRELAWEIIQHLLACTVCRAVQVQVPKIGRNWRDFSSFSSVP